MVTSDIDDDAEELTEDEPETVDLSTFSSPCNSEDVCFDTDAEKKTSFRVCVAVVIIAIISFLLMKCFSLDWVCMNWRKGIGIC